MPERANLTFRGLDVITVTQSESGVQFKLQLSIALSIISATAIVEKDSIDLLTLRNYVVDIVSSFVDMIGFEKSCGYSVEIDSCVYDDGKELVVFGVDIPELKAQDEWNVPDLIGVSQMGSPEQARQLQRSLADFRRAIKISHDTGFYVYRAIESINLAFGDSWPVMNRALNLNQTYTDGLRTSHANPQRHGAYTFMSSADRIDMLIRAKAIINRFISYIKGGGVDLDPSAHPELS